MWKHTGDKMYIGNTGIFFLWKNCYSHFVIYFVILGSGFNLN